MSDLSPEAEQMLQLTWDLGGEAPLQCEPAIAYRAVRAGLAELVTIGVDDPVVVLTPAGLKHCQTRSSSSDSPWSSKLVRVPAL